MGTNDFAVIPAPMHTYKYSTVAYPREPMIGGYTIYSTLLAPKSLVYFRCIICTVGTNSLHQGTKDCGVIFLWYKKRTPGNQ